ncbi:MAG: hypothetical protein HC936_19490 [Leptolyngbyaceae cyanobacterium SU_3_3]|nr:hypothetical protein [Leptolyngbyaceae cyanobacterium SU_3_3]
MQATAKKWGVSTEELLSRVVEKVAHDPHESIHFWTPKNRVFIDTNVLALIAGNTSLGKSVIKHLNDAGLEAVTFSKCVYELYSLLKGTTSDRRDKKSRNNHPLKDFLQPQINDIGQKLFRKTNLDHKANTYYWFSLCEEWMWSDHFESYEELIEKFCIESDREKSREMLSLQKDFVDWKMALRQAFSEVNQKISENGVTVFHYFEVFSSDWYQFVGFSWEQTFAQDSLLPNEDFELVLASIALQAKAFITSDDNDLIWRGGLSLGLNSPHICFCCPERIKEAIDTDFAFRFYRREKRSE